MAVVKMRQRYGLSQAAVGVEGHHQRLFFSSGMSNSNPVINSWKQCLEDLLWVASAFFIVYYGDFHSNLLLLLRNDPRIHRGPLRAGFVCLALDFGILLYILLRLKISCNSKEGKLEITAPSVIPAATMIGLATFILFCIALWPIWSILTVPMLFTLLMAVVVMVSYLQPYVNVRIELESMRY